MSAALTLQVDEEAAGAQQGAGRQVAGKRAGQGDARDCHQLSQLGGGGGGFLLERLWVERREVMGRCAFAETFGRRVLLSVPSV